LIVPVEIERRFLVRDGDWPASATPEWIFQAYFSTNGSATVRVRLSNQRGQLTIKDRRNPPGSARAEFEYEIPCEHAEYLLREMCPYPPLEKLRHKVMCSGSTWMIDEFRGANAGLVIAEVEIGNPVQAFPMPIWAGREVTRDPRFRNSYLYHHPYRDWHRSCGPDAIGQVLAADRGGLNQRQNPVVDTGMARGPRSG